MTNEPFPASMSVRTARDAYLAVNGFTVDAYDAKWTDASLLGIKFRVPNTEKHRVSIMLHDLHHVATGFGTDLAGEGEISAWEARRGLGALGAYVGTIVASGALMGLMLAPKRTVRAWRGSSASDSLFPLTRHDDFKARYERLLAMTVGELRRELGVAEDGVVHGRQGLHAYAPKPTMA
ncbi:MAG TPA: hypothetical protein VGH87_04290 [Polyangiaceae bacterium]|jgi:hypothetical protein